MGGSGGSGTGSNTYKGFGSEDMKIQSYNLGSTYDGYKKDSIFAKNEEKPSKKKSKKKKRKPSTSSDEEEDSSEQDSESSSEEEEERPKRYKQKKARGLGKPVSKDE